jgi:hypothetical protein
MMIDKLFDLSLTILLNRIIKDKFHLNFIFIRQDENSSIDLLLTVNTVTPLYFTIPNYRNKFY